MVKAGTVTEPKRTGSGTETETFILINKEIKNRNRTGIFELNMFF